MRPMNAIASAGVALMATVVAGLAIVNPAWALTPPQPTAEVVFSNGGRILSMDADGGNRRVLFGAARRPANDRLGAIEPAVSPDGGSIVFGFRREADYEDLIDIWVIDADGTGARRLARSTQKVRYGDPGFAPDGRIVAASLTTSRNRAEARIFTMDTGGAHRRVLLRLNQKARPWSSWKSFAEPALSPDGDKLLYLLDPGYDEIFTEGGYETSLRLLDLSSRKTRKISDYALGGAFSPDGKRIAYTAVEREDDENFCWSADEYCLDYSRVRVVNVNGSGGRNLTNGRADERSPDWSDDGRIVFQSARGKWRGMAETTEVYSILPNGKCLTRLTNGSPASLAPAWSDPNGSATGPRACGARPAGPNQELALPSASAVGSDALWLGPDFRSTMLSRAYAGQGGSIFLYGDCGLILVRRCGPPVMLYDFDVCELRGYMAVYLGLAARQKQRGIPVVRETKPGYETARMTFGFSGRTVFYLIGGSGQGDRRMQHRKEIDALRPFGTSKAVVGDLPPPVIPRGDVKAMKRVQRVFARTGTVTRTAKLLKQDVFYVRANLMFGRKFDTEGYRQVRCPREEPLGSLAAVR